MTAQRKSMLVAPAWVAAFLVLASCAATGPKVRTEVDPAADFSTYHTFGFVQPLGTDRSGYQTIVSQQLKAAARRELEARGLRYDEAAPQLLVNFNGRLSEKMRIDSSPQPALGIGLGYGRGYYGYRAGLYGSWPLYTDYTTATPYTEGTLNVDVADAARKQLVWEGIVVGRVTDKERANLQPAIDAAVAAAFAKFPVGASR
jgi:hypothetical protein